MPAGEQSEGAETADDGHAGWAAILATAHEAERNGKVGHAIRLLRQALRSAPKYLGRREDGRSEAWHQLARLYGVLGRLSDADDAYSMATLTACGSAETTTDLLFERLGLERGAEEAAEVAAEEDAAPTAPAPDDERPWLLLAPYRRSGPAAPDGPPAATHPRSTSAARVTPAAEIVVPELQDILDLVGSLDDAGRADAPSMRFRSFLGRSVTSGAALARLLDSADPRTNDQHRRAIQDLVNHAARLLGFEVEFGSYAPASAPDGCDGLWCAGDFELRVRFLDLDRDGPDTTRAVRAAAAQWLIHRRPESRSQVGFLVVLVSATDEQLREAALLFDPARLVHVITVQGILSLLALLDASRITREIAVDLLLPRGVLLDPWIRLLTDARPTR